MFSYEEKPIKSRSKIAYGVVAALIVIGLGVFLIVASLKSNNIDIGKLWLPAVLLAIFALLVTNGAFYRNILTYWLSWLFFAAALVSILAVFVPALNYGHLYPIYIGMPAIASLASLPFSRAKSLHLKIAIFFGSIAGVFALHSSKLINIWITIAIFVIAAGAMIFVNAVTKKRGRWDDGDRPQRENFDYKMIDKDNDDR